MKDYKIIDKCSLCESNTKLIFSLEETPLANEFLDINDEKEQDLFPLNLIQCVECDHVQLDCIVNQSRLYENYNYVSGTSDVNINHFKKYANRIMGLAYELTIFSDGSKYDYYKTSKNIDKTIIEIGSNDGTFLKNFKDIGFDVIGIDPAINLKEIAASNGVETITEFFNKETAIKFVKPRISNKKVKAIICNNMFAHNENLSTIVEGVKELLDDDGVFVFEVSYLLDIVNYTLIDLIYHEHIHHHHIKPLIKFFKKFNMAIFDVERIPNHGGSIRVYVCKEGPKSIYKSVNNILNEEKDINTKLENLEENAKKFKKNIIDELTKARNGKKIIVYGFPAKSTTILYYLGLDKDIIEYGIDDATLKHKLSPGKHIQIYSDTMMPSNGVILILAWNFAKSIIKNHEDFVKKHDGKFIIPLPDYKIIDKNNIDDYLK